eukprot:snap_masked-scaffold_15-processed-gene-1.0-mRNA-1 protein AED:0.07 eAED:0.13 QI:0/-1/0/1/-1/1/1/0/368
MYRRVLPETNLQFSAITAQFSKFRHQIFKTDEIEYKVVSIISLIIINIVLVFSISLSRSSKPEETIHNHRRSNLYLASTAVASSEILKLFISLLLEHYSHVQKTGANFSLRNFSYSLQRIKNDYLHLDTFKVGLPGILYVVENNLLFIALSNLSVTVFEVVDQLKIITTALFSVLILKITLSRLQKLALGLLFGGVIIVEISANEEKEVEEEKGEKNFYLGLFCLLISCTISGFAGVYFEKIVKHSENSASVSIYLRNVQLATYGVCFGLLTVIFSADNQVQEFGFFQNYDAMTWLVIIAQAVAGVINALVIKHANNILKGFAASISTVIATTISCALVGDSLSQFFFFGSFIVMFSIFLYARATRHD